MMPVYAIGSAALGTAFLTRVYCHASRFIGAGLVALAILSQIELPLKQIREFGFELRALVPFSRLDASGQLYGLLSQSLVFRKIGSECVTRDLLSIGRRFHHDSWLGKRNVRASGNLSRRWRGSVLRGVGNIQALLWQVLTWGGVG